MLLNILGKLLKNAIACDDINVILLQGQLTMHEHIKDSALCQVLFSLVYSKLRCSKVRTLVRCQTYNLEMEAYFSTLNNFCQTEQFQFAVLKNSAF